MDPRLRLLFATREEQTSQRDRDKHSRSHPENNRRMPSGLIQGKISVQNSESRIQRSEFRSRKSGPGGVRKPEPLPRAIAVATSGRRLLAEPLAGVRFVGAVKGSQFMPGKGP